MADDQHTARLADAVESVVEHLGNKEPKRAPQRPPIDEAAFRHAVLGDPNNPLRRAQQRKNEYLAREAGRQEHQRRFDREAEDE